MVTWFITSYSCWSELLILGSITWMSSNISLFITTSVVLLKERKTQHHLTRPATFNSSSPTVDLPHERQSRFRNLANFCSWIPESCAFESRIQFKESRIPANNWSPESEFHWQGIKNPVPGIRDLQRGVQNPRLSWITSLGVNRWSRNLIIYGVLRCSLSNRQQHRGSMAEWYQLSCTGYKSTVTVK